MSIIQSAKLVTFLASTATEDNLNVPANGSAEIPLATMPDATTEEDGSVMVQLYRRY